MTDKLPSLPTDPTLKVFVIISTLALLCFAFAAWVRRGDRDRAQTLWLLAPIVLSVVTIVAARGYPMVHRTMSVLILGVAGRNAWRMSGPNRWLSGAGAILWLAGMVLARVMFGT